MQPTFQRRAPVHFVATGFATGKPRTHRRIPKFTLRNPLPTVTQTVQRVCHPCRQLQQLPGAASCRYPVAMTAFAAPPLRTSPGCFARGPVKATQTSQPETASTSNCPKAFHDPRLVQPIAASRFLFRATAPPLSLCYASTSPAHNPPKSDGWLAERRNRSLVSATRHSARAHS